ncbi:MAG TPA: hypothetical protein DDY04_05085 [Bacteroidales bacterium]|nr:hypothetical protein [Bacteroidales bacterium]
MLSCLRAIVLSCYRAFVLSFLRAFVLSCLRAIVIFGACSSLKGCFFSYCYTIHCIIFFIFFEKVRNRFV